MFLVAFRNISETRNMTAQYVVSEWDVEKKQPVGNVKGHLYYEGPEFNLGTRVKPGHIYVENVGVYGFTGLSQLISPCIKLQPDK